MALVIIASYKLQVTCYKLQVTNYKLQVTSYKLQVTSYKLQVTSYKLQVTCYKLQVIVVPHRSYETVSGLSLYCMCLCKYVALKSNMNRKMLLWLHTRFTVRYLWIVLLAKRRVIFPTSSIKYPKLSLSKCIQIQYVCRIIKYEANILGTKYHNIQCQHFKHRISHA